jgi:hypothetical protein
MAADSVSSRLPSTQVLPRAESIARRDLLGRQGRIKIQGLLIAALSHAAASVCGKFPSQSVARGGGGQPQGTPPGKTIMSPCGRKTPGTRIAFRHRVAEHDGRAGFASRPAADQRSRSGVEAAFEDYEACTFTPSTLGCYADRVGFTPSR